MTKKEWKLTKETQKKRKKEEKTGKENVKKNIAGEN